MNKDLEIKKIKLELMKVSTAKAELELKIEERLDEIKRLKNHILIQEQRELELKNDLLKIGE